MKLTWSGIGASRIRRIIVAVLALQPHPVFGSGLEVHTNGQGAAAFYEQGIRAVEQEDYVAALDAFEKAYATQPNFQVLYNIGLAHVALKHPVLAIEHFERYLSEGGSRIESSRATAVMGLIAGQRRLYGVIELHVRPVPTKVSVDGKDVSGATLQVAPGTHLVRLERSGYETSEVSAVIAGGDTVDVVQTLTPLPLPAPTLLVNDRTLDDAVRADVVLEERQRQAALDRQVASDGGNPVLTFGLMGLGMAVAAAGGGLLYYNTLRNEAWVFGGRDESQRTRLETSVRTTDALGYALLGLGGVAVVGGGWLYLTTPGPSDARLGLGLGWVTAF